MSVRKVYDVLVDGKCVFSGSKAMAYEVYYAFQRFVSDLRDQSNAVIDQFTAAPDAPGSSAVLADALAAARRVPIVTIAFQPPAREEPVADGRGIFL